MKAKFLFAALCFAALFTSCGTTSKTELFNGKDLAGWVCVVDENSSVPASEVYGVKEGNIHVVGQPFGYMRTAEKYGDYKFHAEWRWVGEGTNSGLFQRVQDGDRLWCTAIECQLCSGKAGDFVMLGVPLLTARYLAAFSDMVLYGILRLDESTLAGVAFPTA